MKSYTVPVVITTTGWITIEASSLDEAMDKARDLNDGDGVPLFNLQDPDTESECLLDEIEEN